MKKPLEGRHEDHWTYWIPETPEDFDRYIEVMAWQDKCYPAEIARLVAAKEKGNNTRTFRQIMDDEYGEPKFPEPYVPPPRLDDETSRLLIDALKEPN